MLFTENSCEFCSCKDHAHFILYDLQEYDVDYLQALLENNKTIIAQYKIAAKQQEYGPLVPCNFVASSSHHMQHCHEYYSSLFNLCSNSSNKSIAFWHCGLDGMLAPGKLVQLPAKCPTSYLIYTPHDLMACPSIAVISVNPHSHPPPAPIKTPTSLEAVFTDLLHGMGWRLADATPCPIMLDLGFRAGLQKHLGSESENIDLSDLHPSLANLDHIHYIVSKVCNQRLPHGIGFTGVISLCWIDH